MNKNFSFSELNAACSPNTQIFTKETPGGRLLFSRHGARLLGLYPKADGPNTLWINEKISECLKNNNWTIGGERLWIAPERSFFYENPRDFEGFHVPAGIDPGEYTVVDEKDSLCFENVFSLLDYTHNITYDESIERRSYTLVDDPYDTGLAYAGVKMSDTVYIPTTDIDICCWSLAQVYVCDTTKPGTALFPVKKGASIISYFEPIPADRAEVHSGYVRFKLDAGLIFKLGIKPEDLDWTRICKTVYVSPCPDGSDWFCLIKHSNDLPRSQSECVDISRDNPTGPRGTLQSYNGGWDTLTSQTLTFGEIELQLAKNVRTGSGKTSNAIHELYAYMGNKGDILELARVALRVKDTPLHY